jgi:DNA-binding NarL/FixJ family response regulator
MSGSRKGLNVFIVDDSTIIVDQLTLLLSDLKGVTLLGHADTVYTAITSIEKTNPDLVILDIHLKEDAPYANGIDLLAILRKTYPDLIIMMYTNMVGNHYRRKCEQSGANYFFDKSQEFEKLYEVIKELCQ